MVLGEEEEERDWNGNRNRKGGGRAFWQKVDGKEW